MRRSLRRTSLAATRPRPPSESGVEALLSRACPALGHRLATDARVETGGDRRSEAVWRERPDRQPQIRVECVVADAQHATRLAFVALAPIDNQPRVAGRPDPKRVLALQRGP